MGLYAQRIVALPNRARFASRVDRELEARAEVPWELASRSPISIRAEEAWKITRGSPDITVAIIDEDFDRARLPADAIVEFVSVRRGARSPRSGFDHGTTMAELIVGSCLGYPGVAPRCRILGIRLPSVCTAREEARAFDLALEANAAVVCCGWGPPYAEPDRYRLMPAVVSNSIERLSQHSRAGLGAIIFFAVGNNAADTKLDGYVSHPAVTAVGGITASGRKPRNMDFGDGVAFHAPVSIDEACLGGPNAVPQGTSGAVALAAGAAALTLSANPRISSVEAIEVLTQTAAPIVCVDSNIHAASRPRIINAESAVKMAKGFRALTSPSPIPNCTEQRSPDESDRQVSFRERRFIGGEHWLLGHFGALALQGFYKRAGSDPTAAFFDGDLKKYMPSGVGNVFGKTVRDLLNNFFSGDYLGPGWNVTISDLGFSDYDPPGLPYAIPPEDWFLPYAALVGVAADHLGTPNDMVRDIINPGEIRDHVNVFKSEIESGFTLDTTISLLLAQDFREPGHAQFLSLAKKNYSHFAGDNLLFYLSYHLLAVSAARQCNSSTASPDDIEKAFKRALFCEAFAAHYLTDMFSAGHARVPRYAFLYKVFKKNLDRAHLLSRLLHEHEGRLGVVLANALGNVWLAQGDGGLLAHKDDGSLRPIYVPGPVWKESLPIDVLGWTEWSLPAVTKLAPVHLAASLVCASLADVVRHMAGTNDSTIFSAEGSVGVDRGLLGYILDRVPFALPSKGQPRDMVVGIRSHLGLEFSGTALSSRMLDEMNVCKTYLKVPELLRPHPFFSRSPTITFANEVWPDLIFPPNESWAAPQIAHLLTNLTRPSGPVVDRFLHDVPELVGGGVPDFPPTFDMPKDMAEAFDAHGTLPANWKDAVPDELVQALTSQDDGVWGVDP